MTIDEIAVLPPHILRDIIINGNVERNKHIFTFGFSLWRIKNEPFGRNGGISVSTAIAGMNCDCCPAIVKIGVLPTILGISH